MFNLVCRMSRLLKLLFVALFLSVALVTQGLAQQKENKPNVILIVSDDHGTLDLNSYGSDDLYTPHLDALARRGVRFTQFYVAAPICSPSRGALLTGRYPQRNGVVGNSQPFNEDEVTIAQMLKNVGYQTGQFGKWHIGHGRPDTSYANAAGPNAFGFDYSFGFLGGCIDKWSHFNYGGDPWGDPPKRHDLHRNGKEVWATGTHSGDLIVQEASDFMTRHQEKPFFMYVAFGSPHYPMQPYDKYRKRYADLPAPRRKYAALVSTLDEQIGDLTRKVNALGLQKETIIIFMSDHGHSTEARANYGGGNAGPYRGAKSSLFEGGIRVPAIISYPGKLPEGKVREQLVTAMDWLPTVAGLTGAAMPDRSIDGKSLLEVIQSSEAASPHKTVYWHRPGGQQPQWAVRKGKWKLVKNARDTDRKRVSGSEQTFLSNMDKAVSEQHNLADKYPQVVKRLTKDHRHWLQEVQ